MRTNKFASFSAISILLVIAGFLVAALIAAFLISPNLVKSLAKRIQGTANASRDPDIAGRFLVQGDSDSTTILVKFKPSVSEKTINNIQSKTRTKTKNKIDKINVRVVSLPVNASVGQTIDIFKKYKEVQYAEPNFIASAEFIPNDPLYTGQWNLNKVAAPAAWDSSKGDSIPVAVVDTGVMSNHSDLSGEVGAGYNFVSGNTNAADDNGHGTHVSGIVSALTNNSNGVASIGYKSTIIPVKVLDRYGSGSYANVASGIVYAADKGAKVINLSLGGASPSTTLQDAVTYATNKGVYVVAAAGNSSSSLPLYPAGCTGAIAISATDSSDNLAYFSNYGKNIFAGAPGVTINSTYNNGSYVGMSGTSMATPHFSGMVELALSYAGSTGRSVSRTQMLDYIKSASDKVGTFSYDSTGWNQYFGYGRINANKLLAAIGSKSPSLSPTPAPSLSPSPLPSSPTATPTQTPPVSTKFNTVLSGTIDYISVDKTIIRLKVTSISQNLKVGQKEIVDLKLTSQTSIKRRGRSISVSQLRLNDRLNNVKALYADNSLSALVITAQ